MNNHEWRAETHRRIGLVAKYFKPKEVQTLFDSVATAQDVSKEEKSAKAESTEEAAESESQ